MNSRIPLQWSHVLCVMCVFADHTWHLIPARLHVQVSGSQKSLQSQPQSSLDTLMARSSCFSSTSSFLTPDERSRARRFLVVSGWRKKYSSTSVLSISRSSSEMSSSVRALASSDSTEPFFVNWGRYKRWHKKDIFAQQYMRNKRTVCLPLAE